MAPKMLPAFIKAKRVFAPFTKRAVIPFSPSSVSTTSTNSSIDKLDDQTETKVEQKKLTLEEKKKFFSELLIDTTYSRSLRFIISVCELIDEELAVLNGQLIERGFDLGEARARRKSRVFFPHSVSKEEIKCAKQLDEVNREIEFYRQQKAVFEELCNTRIQQIEFVKQLRQKNQMTLA